MKLSINKALGLLGGLLLNVVSPSSWATVSCTFAANATQAETVPLSPAAISAGADIPVGTILYQGTWVMNVLSMPCTWAQSDVGKSFWYNAATIITNTPLPLSSLTTGPFAGAVYQTNIPGIGVVISRASDGNPITVTRNITADTEIVIKQVNNELGGLYNFSGAIRYISLIKTGPITPGNYTLSGANIPSVKTTIDPALNSHVGSATVIGFPFTFYNVNFQGNLTVSTQTCTTPDVAVAMGTHNINTDFSGVNSTTPWVDASIIMTNCPTFYGFYNSTNTTLLMDYGTGKSGVTTALNNTAGVRLTPATTVTDSGNGIMAIDSTVAGAASGVGIQLGWGDSSQTPALFNFASEYPMTLPKDGSRSIRIPLAARYIQTAAKPTPGKANGKAIFLINYY